jgi:peptidyl-prolyl cis-trans isomerase A (cyclophilin A)
MTMRTALAAVLVAGATAMVAAQAAKPAPKPAAAPAKPAAPAQNRLLNPAALNAKAPDLFKVKFDTTKGPVVIELHREWAPKGVDRFYNLVRAGFFTNVRFFRVIHTFMAQFGVNGDPAVNAAWEKARLTDDPPNGQHNVRGMLTYGTTGQPNSRGTQLFINYKDNSFLDAQGFVPIGQVVEGMEAVDMLDDEYGAAPQNNQGRIVAEGNKYLQANFPKLDYIKTATIEK